MPLPHNSRDGSRNHALLVGKFKSERRRSTITLRVKPERDRSVASVNRGLELLSRIFTLAIGRPMTDGKRV